MALHSLDQIEKLYMSRYLRLLLKCLLKTIKNAYLKRLDLAAYSVDNHTIDSCGGLSIRCVLYTSASAEARNVYHTAHINTTTPTIFTLMCSSEIIAPIAIMIAQVVTKPWTEKVSKLAQKLLEHVNKLNEVVDCNM